MTWDCGLENYKDLYKTVRVALYFVSKKKERNQIIFNIDLLLHIINKYS